MQREDSLNLAHRRMSSQGSPRSRHSTGDISKGDRCRSRFHFVAADLLPTETFHHVTGDRPHAVTAVAPLRTMFNMFPRCLNHFCRSVIQQASCTCKPCIPMAWRLADVPDSKAADLHNPDYGKPGDRILGMHGMMIHALACVQAA